MSFVAGLHTNALDATGRDTDHLETDLEIGQLRPRREPRLRRPAYTTQLLRIDHLERIAVPIAGLLLHLDDEESPAAADDQIELVAADALICAYEPPTAEQIVPRGTALARVHEATASISSGTYAFALKLRRCCSHGPWARTASECLDVM